MVYAVALGAARGAADRADDDGVREQGRGARRARDRLRSHGRCSRAHPRRSVSTGARLAAARGGRARRLRGRRRRSRGIRAPAEPAVRAARAHGRAAADRDPPVARRGDASSTGTTAQLIAARPRRRLASRRRAAARPTTRRGDRRRAAADEQIRRRGARSRPASARACALARAGHGGPRARPSRDGRCATDGRR